MIQIARPARRQKLPDNPLLGGTWTDEDVLLEDVKSRRLTKLKNLRDDWLKSTNRKIQANAIRSQVQGILAQNDLALEARRARFELIYMYSLLFCAI